MQFTLPRAQRRRRDLGMAAFDPKGLLGRLGRLEDRRGARGRRPALAPVVMLILLARLAGEDPPLGIADWLGERAADLGMALQLPWPRMPHHNTARRVPAFVVGPAPLDQLASQHLRSPPGVGTSRLIALDAKTVRGTSDPATAPGDHLPAAYLAHEGIGVGQIAVGAREDEIARAPALLRQGDLRGKIAIGDALPTQRQLSEPIVAGGGGFAWRVEDNQPRVRAEIALLFAPPTPTGPGDARPDDFARYERRETGHGRRERRAITVSSELTGYSARPQLAQVSRLERERADRASGVSGTEGVWRERDRGRLA
jgi:hypothetical protein